MVEWVKVEREGWAELEAWAAHVPEAHERGQAGPWGSRELWYRDVYEQPEPGFREALEAQTGDGVLGDWGRRLEAHGIVALRGLFDAAQVEAMRRDFEGWCRGRAVDAKGHVQFDGAAPDGCLTRSRALSEAVVEPRLVALAAWYWGKDVTLAYARGYRLEPIAPVRYRAFQPHIDGHGRELKAMVLLSDVPPGGQRMRYWPGTHTIEWPIASSRDTVFTPSDAAAYGAPVECCGPAGTVFVFDTHGLHTGVRNSTRRRDVYVVNFTGGLRLYPVPAPHPEAALRAYARRVWRQPAAGPGGAAAVASMWAAAAQSGAGVEVSPAASCPARPEAERVPRRVDAPDRGWGVAVSEVLALPRGVPQVVPCEGLPGVHALMHQRRPLVVGAWAQVREVVARVRQARPELALPTRAQAQAWDNSLAPAGALWVREGCILAPQRHLCPWTHARLHDGLAEDLHGDLDLPLRRYAPHLDRDRDVALGLLRDDLHARQGGTWLAAALARDLDRRVPALVPLAAARALRQLAARLDRAARPAQHDPQRVDVAVGCGVLAHDLERCLLCAHEAVLVRRSALFAWALLAFTHSGLLAADADDRAASQDRAAMASLWWALRSAMHPDALRAPGRVVLIERAARAPGRASVAA